MRVSTLFGICVRKLLLLQCVNLNINSGRSYTDPSGVLDISDCSFSRYLVFSSSGGILYVSDKDCNLTVNDCMFYSCRVGHQGGAIFFKSPSTGECRMRKCCAFLCKCGENLNGQFHYSWISSNNQNVFEMVSYTQCPNNNLGYDSVFLYYGNQKVQGINSSYNSAYSRTGFYTCVPSSTYFFHCTFVANKASHDCCYSIGTKNFDHLLSYSNFVSNQCAYFVISSGLCTIQDCVFANNYNTLFSSPNISVCNSIIDHGYSMGKTILCINCINSPSLTLCITHYSSFYCQTPPKYQTKSPSNTLSKHLLLFCSQVMGMLSF